MKMKHFLLGSALVVAVAAVWTGRAVYRARHNLVTLEVYNAPLADVVHQMESQTREKIVIPKGFESKVTLTLKNVPLEEALDRLGEQAGANWSRWHAVYESGRALDQLEVALQDRAKLADIGWTNLAPQMSFGGDLLPGMDKLPAGAVTISSDVQASASPQRKVIRLSNNGLPAGGDPVAIGEKLKAAGVHPGMHMVTRTRDANGAVTEEVWSPEHVVLEEKLHPKLGPEDFSEASEIVARQVATKVKGRLATLFVLRPTPAGISFGSSIVRNFRSGTPGDTNAAADQLPPMLNLEAAVQRAQAENYTRLTPEQRVQRAREKQAAKASQ